MEIRLKSIASLDRNGCIKLHMIIHIRHRSVLDVIKQTLSSRRTTLLTISNQRAARNKFTKPQKTAQQGVQVLGSKPFGPIIYFQFASSVAETRSLALLQSSVSATHKISTTVQRCPPASPFKRQSYPNPSSPPSTHPPGPHSQ